MANGRDRLKKIREENKVNKNEKFIIVKMWISFIVSLMAKDRGAIPKNIGNNILITNNMMITSSFMTSVIHIIELSPMTPITFITEMIIHDLRKEDCKALVDFTIKNTVKNVNLGDQGLKSRINTWERSERNKYLLKKDRDRSSILLYTVDQIREGKDLFDSRTFLKVRAESGPELKTAEKIVFKTLARYGCIYNPINTSLNDVLEYALLISDMKTKRFKSLRAVVNSSRTLAQLLPNLHAPGSKLGIRCGINTINYSHYRLNLSNITMARNIYIIGPSGGGKTALALNMAASALEEGFNFCAMDVKGNEFNELVDAVGGATISLRESSTEYINTFKMLKEETNDEEAEIYFKTRLNFSKKQMLILSGLEATDLRMQLDGFLDEFMEYYYTAKGVKANNRNTWDNTLDSTPYEVYDVMTAYLNQPIKEKYINIYSFITTNLKMYYSRTGSRSYIFRDELQYKDLLDRRAVRFDFGLLEGQSYDSTIFKLKFEYMSRINGEYVTNNFNKRIKTFKILEESQAVSSDVMESYAREYTLRRAQDQTTLLLGNSVDALVRNPASMPIIETTTALFVGRLSPTSAELVIKYFDVKQKEGMIRLMSEQSKYEHHFLVINNMEANALTPIVKVEMEPFKDYKLLNRRRKQIINQ